MIALPRTRDFSASNWQRFLAKQQPECGTLVGVYLNSCSFRAEQTAGPLETVFTVSDKTPRRRFKMPQVP